MEGSGIAAATAICVPSPRIYHLLNNLTPAIRRRFQQKKQLMQGFIDQAGKNLAEKGSNFQPRSAAEYMISREVAAAKRAERQVALNQESLRDNLLRHLVGGQGSTHATLSFCEYYPMYRIRETRATNEKRW